MVSLLSTKFHEILFSSFRGVALKNCVTDRRTGQKQYVSPQKCGGGGDIMKLLKKIENRQHWQKKLYIISKITSRYLKRWHILWLPPPPLICTFQNMYICMDMLIYLFFMILLHGQEIKMSTLCTSTGKYSCSVGQGLMDTNADHLSS